MPTGNQINLPLAEAADNGGLNQSNEEGNEGVSAEIMPTDNERNLELTGQADNGVVNQSNQEGNGVSGSGQAANCGRTNQSNEEGKGGLKRADLIDVYEKELRVAWRWACSIGSLHACSQFLAFCNLTWATVVLLGAFVPYLVPLDFDFVVCLLLLEGARLSSASFFTRLLRRALAYLSQDPKRIEHPQDEHYPRAHLARIGSQLLQFIFIFPGVIMPASRVFSQLDDYDFVDARNVQKSLRIFYGSVLFNSIVALLYLVCSAIASVALTKKFPKEQSILRYFDKVLENAMYFGVVQADDFEFFHFAYTMLGGEFRRNVQPEAVAKNHKELIKYMYGNRIGVNFVQIYLDAEDAFVQLAAVNMVGFWADTKWGGVGSEVVLPDRLLTKLADKVGMGQVGWAAATCFGVLARTPKWTDKLASLKTSSGSSLLAHLVDLIDVSSKGCLSIVRTLGQFYELFCVNKSEAPKMPFAEEELVAKLKTLAREAKLDRLRVQAAYLLLLMGEECDCEVIRGINPTRDSYWFQSEKEMLQTLRKFNNDTPFDFPAVGRPTIRSDHSINPPPWAQNSAAQKVIRHNIHMKRELHQ